MYYSSYKFISQCKDLIDQYFDAIWQLLIQTLVSECTVQVIELGCSNSPALILILFINLQIDLLMVKMLCVHVYWTVLLHVLYVCVPCSSETCWCVYTAWIVYLVQSNSPSCQQDSELWGVHSMQVDRHLPGQGAGKQQHRVWSKSSLLTSVWWSRWSP